MLPQPLMGIAGEQCFEVEQFKTNARIGPIVCYTLE